MPNSLDNRSSRANILAWVLIAVIGVWLAWSLNQVDIDFDDGYATLTNTRFRIGVSDLFYSNRAPLMALLMVPAELLKNSLGLHPMDVRVAHALMALLHLAYVAGAWMFLTRVHGRDYCSLIAYAAAIATPVFFSYAPFLSHDIFPGLLSLWMVYLANRYLNAPALRDWLALVILGTILAMLKQLFAMIWIAIIAVVPLLLLRKGADKQQWRILPGLCVAAAFSGLLTWLAYGIALAPGFGSEPFWLRPWLQISLISSNYAVEGGAWEAFYPWVYLQNLSAYGILTMLLIVPGLGLALTRGTSFEWLVALVWLFMVVFLHITPYKEVRYVAVLAPFNAVLLVPILRRLWSVGPAFRVVVTAVLTLSLGLSVLEALRIRNSYYARAITDFLEPLPSRDAFQGRLIIGAPLSFVSPEAQAYYGDRYHRITHLTLDPILSAYGYGVDQYLRFVSVREIDADLVRPGDIGLLASGALGRVTPFVRGNRSGLASDFLQVLGLAEVISLQRDEGGYHVAGSAGLSPFIVLSTSIGSAPSLVDGHLAEAEARRLFGWTELPESADVMAFRVLRRCSLLGCVRTKQG